MSIPLPGGSSVVFEGYYGFEAGFNHTDYLGNSIVNTYYPCCLGGKGTYVSSRSYAPFGQQFDVAGSQEGNGPSQGFDGIANLLDYTGLWDTPARELDPIAGRWISPDLAGRNAVNMMRPQTWNRYNYGSNDPLSRFDPTGLEDLNDDPNYVLAGGAGGALVDPATVVGILDFLDNELFGPPITDDYTMYDTGHLFFGYLPTPR